MARKPSGDPPSPAELQEAIETFLRNARQPALLEPGEELMPLDEGNYELAIRGSRLMIQAWDRKRNWSRRIVNIGDPHDARLEMTVERFAKREGQMFLLDLSRRHGADMGKRSGRLVFRERFRLFLRRQFPDWNLSEISSRNTTSSIAFRPRFRGRF